MITRNEMSLELLLLLAPEFEHGWPVRERSCFYCLKHHSVKHYYMIHHNLREKKKINLHSRNHSEKSVLDQSINKIDHHHHDSQTKSLSKYILVKL